jgi:hypothetical protein
MNMARFYQNLPEVVEIYFHRLYISTKTALNIYIYIYHILYSFFDDWPIDFWKIYKNTD